jgi:serine/threonine-protein kinase
VNRLKQGFVLGGRYELQERIASGGMADVWRGVDTVLQRVVALKVMRPDDGHESLFVARFRDEAVHSAGLNHTNIATVFDYGEDDHLSYLVMELVEGDPLSAVIRGRGPLNPDEVKAIAGQAALALGVAHEARVVHRDVKPANILIRTDGVVKLTDFGIARALDASGHTRHGEMLGTPDYISPEQAKGEPATGASDLYALGVVMHEMLTGKRPFDRGTPIATAFSHVTEPPPPLPDHVPAELAELVEDCLAKDPRKRPANALVVAERLGFHGHETMGLAIGLAATLDGRPDDQRTDPGLDRAVTGRTMTPAVDLAPVVASPAVSTPGIAGDDELGPTLAG